MFGLKRRDFIALLGGAAAWPLAALAQQAGKTARVGFLGPSLNSPSPRAHFQAFLAQLRGHGFDEGKNLTVDHRALDDPRGPFVAATDLIRLQPDLVVALGPEIALRAVLNASPTIPIVMVAVNFDPLERGHIASLARPGSNITGLIYRQPELASKQVELLTQAFPGRTRLAILWDEQTQDQFTAAERAAKKLSIELREKKLERPPYDFLPVFRDSAISAADMLLVLSSPFFIPQIPRIVALTMERRLPAMFVARQWVEAGGLMSYGVNFPTMYRRAADYVARVLNGARPADLPAEQAARFEMVVNLRAARTMGLDLSTSILLRADEVIE